MYNNSSNVEVKPVMLIFTWCIMTMTNKVRKTEYLFYFYAERIVTDLESTPHSSKNPLATATAGPWRQYPRHPLR